MRFAVISVGKIKDGYLQDGVNDYLKRLRPYMNTELIEGLEEKTPPSPSEAAVKAVVEKEGRQILARLKDGDFVIALDARGSSLSSEGLAGFMQEKMNQGFSRLVWIIGGSHGLSPEVLARADYTLSLSKMTFLHQMTAMILLEQIYRGFKILKGEPYHK